MPLSEYEQRVLEQMERQLASDDPRLANTLTQRGRRPVLRYVLSSIGAAAGLRGNEAKVYDVRQFRKDPALDVRLQPGDRVEVPQSFF